MLHSVKKTDIPVRKWWNVVPKIVLKYLQRQQTARKASNRLKLRFFMDTAGGNLPRRLHPPGKIPVPKRKAWNCQFRGHHLRVKVQTLASSLSVMFPIVSVWNRCDYGSIDGNLPVFSDSPGLDNKSDLAPFLIISEYSRSCTCSSSIC